MIHLSAYPASRDFTAEEAEDWDTDSTIRDLIERLRGVWLEGAPGAVDDLEHILERIEENYKRLGVPISR